MKIKDIALSAAAIGERVVKAIAIGAVEVWSAVKYIVFKDPVVAQICATNFGDGKGISEEQAAAVTSVGTVFKGNTEIKNFDELAKFTEVTTLGSDCFKGCTNLRTINLSNIEEIGGSCFRESSIVYIDAPKLKSIVGGDNFLKCANLTSDVSHPLLEGTIPTRAYYMAGISRVINLGKVTSIDSVDYLEAFGNCPNLWHVHLPETLTNIGNGAFKSCGELREVISDNPAPPTLGNNVFVGTNASLSIYVPDQSVQAYREASGWLSYADKILPMEAYLYGYIKFADPAVEAICLANWDTNGSGYLNKEEAKAVTDIGEVFRDNTEITSFNELEEFTGITAIPQSAFANCANLKSISIPTIRNIGVACFYNCSKLMDIYMHSETPPYLGFTAFLDSRNVVVYVPDESVLAYRSDSTWSADNGRVVGMSYKDRLMTDNYVKNVGQSYGNVNSNINFTTDSDYEWAKFPIEEVESVIVRSADSIPSSLIQYVDSNGKILHLDATTNPRNVLLYEIAEITGATHVYVSSAAGTMRIYGKPKE